MDTPRIDWKEPIAMEDMERLLPEPLQPYGDLIVGIATALAIFVIGWMVSKWAYSLALRAARKSEVDEALARFLSSLAQYAVLAMAVIAALSKVGVQTTSLVALLGAAGLAVGLALQGNLANLASGVMLLLFRPFTLEDRVRVAGEIGTVKDIGLFATTMQTPANERIIVPNAAITDAVIVNYTANDVLRASVALGVAYGTDLEKAMAAIEKACRSVPAVLDEPEPGVVLTGFGASSVDFEARVWSATDDVFAMQHDVRLAVYRVMEEEGIEIPFDQLVLHQAPADEAE